MESAIAGREDHFQILQDGRCRCTLNGHTFSSDSQEVLKFIGGAKYQRLLIQAENKKQLKRYEPFIYTSKNFDDKMYCSLTCHLMNMKLASIERHIQGKKYKRAKELYDKGEFALIEEPDLEEEEEEKVEAPLNADDSPSSSHMMDLDMDEEAELHIDNVTEPQNQQRQAKRAAAPCSSPVRQKLSKGKPRKKRHKAVA